MRLILASRSPRRRQLLTDAGFEFEVIKPRESAECGVCSRETPPELVVRLAYQKARDVAERVGQGIIIGCDTVAECHGQILGKPVDSNHARQMLTLMRGRPHRVFSGVCLWRRPDDLHIEHAEMTQLRMDAITDEHLDKYLESGQWQGKAGAFGYQDRPGWVHITAGSQSNVVGLPMERLRMMLAELQGR